MPIKKITPQAVNQWFHLLSAIPSFIFETGKAEQFSSVKSAKEASQWLASHSKRQDVENITDKQRASVKHLFGQGMALSFSLPFGGLLQREKQEQNTKEPADLQQYIDFMVKEIQLTSNHLADDAEISYLHWTGNMVHWLNPAEMTQLIFHSQRAFNLLQCKRARRVFELDNMPESAETLALLAGLGFNTVCFNKPLTDTGAMPTNQWLDWLDIAGSFGITTQFVRLNMTTCRNRFESLLQELLQKHPTGLHLTMPDHLPTPTQMNNLKTARRLLKEANYLPIHKNFFIDCQDSHYIRHSPPCCWKGIGVGSISYTTNYQLCNTHQLEDYYARLSAGQLPIDRVIKLDAPP